MKRVYLCVSTFVVIAVLTVVGIAAFSVPTFAVSETQEEISDLEGQIEDKEAELEELREKIDTYKATIRERQLESLSLESQISILENDMKKTEAEIQEAEAQIDVLQLEIDRFQAEIDLTQEDINTKKAQLEYFLLTTYKNDRVTPLEVALTQDQFSDFFRQVEYVTTIQGQFQTTLDEVQELKKVLERQQSSIEAKSDELEEEQLALQQQKSQLAGEQQYKINLLDETQQDEEQFQKMVEEAQNAQNAANNAIISLEREIRERLKKPDPEGEEEEEDIKLPGELSLMWPVPSRYITAGFHDSTYPFRRYFEHPAIDIRAGQGTPVAAADTGVVGIAKDAGMGYSYIMIVHGNGFSTVYGHISSIYVTPGEYVQKGDTIGLSGGMPGTPGAGIFTTGPHLHFEVRLNGIPVNPVLYLP